MSGPPVRTVAGAVREATRALQAAGIDEPGFDARLLVAAAIAGDAAELIRAPERALSAAEAATLDAMTRRRVAREPVSRILGRREFYGRRFAITPDVLDPRADTETVVEVALEVCGREGWHQKPIRILDLGTGSGCLLVTLLAELPQAVGVGLDISQAALEVASSNARALGVGDRATFEAGDMSSYAPGGFDLVVSNPPYIPSADRAGLAPEVATHDPKAALDGGADGLAFYRSILTAVYGPSRVSTTPQWLVLEAGFGQATQIVAIARQLGGLRSDVGLILRRDLGGVTRCVAIRSRG